MKKEEYIGYIRYEGALVEKGLMDVRKQGEVLLAIDYALRYFLNEQFPELRNLEFEIPVKIRKGSWEVLIPTSAVEWGERGLYIMLMAYLAKTGSQLASKYPADVGVIELFKKSLDGVIWFARITKHMGNSYLKSFENLRYSDDNSLIGICNTEGEYIYVPRNILNMYIKGNSNLFEKLVENIEEGRDLIMGTTLNGEVNEIAIRLGDKNIFLKSDKDVIFPELVHGEYVKLEGEVISENKKTNIMGFKYKEYVLNAYPEPRNIVPYKSSLFLKCRLYGIVRRIDKKGNSLAKPNLYFDRLESLEENEGLFRK